MGLLDFLQVIRGGTFFLKPFPAQTSHSPQRGSSGWAFLVLQFREPLLDIQMSTEGEEWVQQ